MRIKTRRRTFLGGYSNKILEEFKRGVYYSDSRTNWVLSLLENGEIEMDLNKVVAILEENCEIKELGLAARAELERRGRLADWPKLHTRRRI